MTDHLIDPPRSITELLRGPIPPTPEQLAGFDYPKLIDAFLKEAKQ